MHILTERDLRECVQQRGLEELAQNVPDKGIVKVTASTVYENHSSFHPKNALDLGKNLGIQFQKREGNSGLL